MIRIGKTDLSTESAAKLAQYQRAIDDEPDYTKRVELADARFKQYNRRENPTFAEVRRTLDEMCSGACRCMYCEDSAADEVEHHRPKNLYPDRVFLWENYLYACG